jgi:hypothetical protein
MYSSIRSLISAPDGCKPYTLEETQVGPTVQKDAGWASERVWTCWRIEKSFALAGIRAPYRPANRLVTIPTELLIVWKINLLATEFYI